MNPIILDLCGGSGSWSKPYVEAGYDVRLITLPDYDVTTYTPQIMFMGYWLRHLVLNSLFLIALQRQETANQMKVWLWSTPV